MATQINLASDFTNGVYTATGVAASNNYAVIMITWANLDGYPELVVETALEDVAASYHPAKTIDSLNVEQPIKFRFPLEDSLTNDGTNITVDSIFGTTPFVRFRIYAGTATAGTITFTIDAGA